LQAAIEFAKGQLFLDSGASTTLIHDVSMLVNVRRLSEPKMVIGLTGPRAINFTGDLCLEMLNTTGKSSKIVVKDVSIMIRLCNTTCLASLTFHELVMLPHF